MSFSVFSLVLSAFLTSGALSATIEVPRSFEVDYANSQFLKDGEPFRYVAGEMHYFRIPQIYWKDRLHKLKAAGANTLQTYIEWSEHEPTPNLYRFDGQYDVVKFIKLAQEEGLNVIIRPGPYICAEREFGGYPAWMLSMNPNVKLRTSDPSHTYFVARWFRSLMPQIVPLLYGNGGPIIMVQVENEYGSYPVNDQKYLAWLRDLFQSYIKNNAVLFTTDGAGASYISKGRISGVLTTIDFGPSSTKVLDTFKDLEKFQPQGPLVNSEYYVGWLSYWGQTFATIDTKSVISSMEDMLESNVSFSMYMFHGGSNFGFSAGSGSDQYFQADLTSYDYDAPISEAGDLTEKYYAIQNLLSKYYPVEKIDESISPKLEHGPIFMEPIIGLFDSPIGKDTVSSNVPLTFEQIDQKFGFVSYETKILTPSKDPSVLQVTVRDRGIVYLEKEEVSVLMYTVINETPLPSSLKQGQTLRILVENMGRRNYGRLSDCTKGLVSNATIDRHTVTMWNITGYPLNHEDIAVIEHIGRAFDVSPPAFYTATFQLGENKTVLDTYLDMSGWGKGVAFINGFNLGRYWKIGPQMTLYVPGSYLKAYPEDNTLTILELHSIGTSQVRFTNTPILNNTVT